MNGNIRRCYKKTNSNLTVIFLVTALSITVRCQRSRIEREGCRGTVGSLRSP